MNPTTLQSAGLLVLRLVVGTTFLVHGLDKLSDLSAAEQFFAAQGIPAPGAMAPFVGATETVGRSTTLRSRRRMRRLVRAPGSDLGRFVAPCEVFTAWRRAQLEVDRHARDAPPSPHVLRTTGLLPPELAERVTEWFTATPTTPTETVRRSYQALEREATRLFEIARRDLGVRVRYTSAENDPYGSAAELCAELREHGSMTLTTIACDEPHPLLGGGAGGVVDQHRVVHDVFGHAALGVGFDLQSEFATWLQCRTLFSGTARPAAFCELVGAVTAYVMTGDKPGLRAKVPPADLFTACEVSFSRGRVVSSHEPRTNSRPPEPVRPAAVAA